jgi:hypothetical protein
MCPVAQTGHFFSFGLSSRGSAAVATGTHHGVALMEIRAQAERDSGIGLKLFGFIAESVFTFIPESCSHSPRNGVRNHPGIAFTFPRIPHLIESTILVDAFRRYP